MSLPKHRNAEVQEVGKLGNRDEVTSDEIQGRNSPEPYGGFMIAQWR